MFGKKSMSGNAKFIMQKGREVGNLPKKIKQDAPAGAGKAPDRKKHMAHKMTAPTTGKPLKGQKVETDLTQGPFANKRQSPGKVNSTFKVK